MRKKEKILIAVLVLIAVIMLISIAVGKGEETKQPTGGNTSGGGEVSAEIKIDSLNNAEEMKTAIDKIYTKNGQPYVGLQTTEIDVNNDIMLGTYTGLASNKDIEAAVVSEDPNATEAYSLVMVKVAEVGDVETLKEWILDHINVKKWVWFSAEKVYVTNYNNTIVAVVGSEYMSKEIYDTFKEIVDGNIGTELVRTTADDPEEEQVDAE